MKNRLLKPALLILMGLMLMSTLAGACAKPATEPATVPNSTPAAQTIKLKFGTLWPVTNIVERWIDKIQNETNGRVQITLYPGGTLIDQFAAYDELRSGVADIAEFGSGFAGSPFLIANALESFICGVDMIGTRKIFDDLWKEFPELRAEYTEVKILCAYGSSGQYVHTTRKPIYTLDDFKGMQLMPDPRLPELLGKLGATGSLIPMTEVYNALDKNIIDGTIGPVDALVAHNLAEVTKYSTNLHIAEPPNDKYAMNLDTWNSLPKDIQKVFEDSSTWWATEFDNAMLKQQQESMDFAKAKGHEFIELTPADLDKFYSIMESIALTKATDLDSKGLPGTKVYQEAHRLSEEYNKAN